MRKGVPLVQTVRDMKYASKRLELLTPYVPGEQPRVTNLIKLNTNENPYPPSPKAVEAMRGAIGESLRLYPDPESLELRRAIAARHGLEPQNVMVGNGSDELLALCFLSFTDVGGSIRYFDITYSFYPVYAQLFGVAPKVLPLNDDFTADVEAMLSNDSPLIFPNPNAPTAIALGLEDIERILQANRDNAVIVDEAYVEFGAQSADSLINKYDNLLIIRTFSKSHSLAGLRAGYALGSEGMITAMNSVKNSFNSYPLDRIAQAGATAAILDESYTRQCCSRVMATRESAAAGLRLLGFDVTDSRANFLFASHPDMGAAQIKDELRARGIIVRHFAQGRVSNSLRISIGTDDDMTRLLTALKEILNGREQGK